MTTRIGTLTFVLQKTFVPGLAVLLFLIFGLGTCSVAAQDTGVPNDKPAPTQTNTSVPAATPHLSFGSTGLLLATADNSNQLRVHGYVQADNRMFDGNLHGETLDTFFFRRIRPLFEGTLCNAIDFRFMPDFGQNNPQIQEAYVELKTVPVAKLRIGKFKEPIGLEALRSDRELTFAERSLVSDLVPLRYLGAQVGGIILSQSVEYQVGYFNGSSDGSNGKFEWIRANEAVLRLFVRPFVTTDISAVQHLGVGLAGSSGEQHGALASLKTMGQSTFFKYSSSVMANGQHNRLSPQAYYYIGPIGVLSEYVLSSQEVVNKSITRRVRNQAWQAAGSVVLTGEENEYGGVRPRNSFQRVKGFRRLGAVELAFRYSKLQVDGGAFEFFANPRTAAQQAAATGLALNWYLNRYLKLVTDYEHTRFRMASSAIAPFHSESVLLSRIQLAF